MLLGEARPIVVFSRDCMSCEADLSSLKIAGQRSVLANGSKGLEVTELGTVQTSLAVVSDEDVVVTMMNWKDSKCLFYHFLKFESCCEEVCAKPK